MSWMMLFYSFFVNDSNVASEECMRALKKSQAWDSELKLEALPKLVPAANIMLAFNVSRAERLRQQF